MKRQDIPPARFIIPPVHAWADQWLLLTAGQNKPGAFNCMTVGWGGFGVMWSKPMAMIVVRPGRYTYEFLEKSDSFTLCAFAEEHKDKLQLCGSKSGRKVDKIAACKLTPIPSGKIAAPGYEEAELIVECRKMYFDDLDPKHFLAPDIAGNYPQHDYHRMYFGEILAIRGIARYANKRG